MSDLQEEAFELGPDDVVGCYYSMQSGVHKTYRRGEAYLVTPAHPPIDGNANYVCKFHMTKGVEIWDPYAPENQPHAKEN